MILDKHSPEHEQSLFITNFTKLLLSPTALVKPAWKSNIHLISPADKDTQDLISSVDLLTEPELSVEGSSGVYFLKNVYGDKVAVFKPLDEEPGAARNPRHKEFHDSVPPFFSPGLGFLNEYAAYQLDKSMGAASAGVPLTCVVAINWPWNADGESPRLKFGSLQKFVSGEDVCDFGSGYFSTKDVQKIALLDMRILNCDRHFSNLLVSKEGHLIPIDHGYSFPMASKQLNLPSFDWLLWPQTKEETVTEVLDAIKSMDIQEDIKKMTSFGISDDAMLAFWMSNSLLKIGSEYGFTLHQIGSLIQRLHNRSEPSALEVMFATALEKFVNNKSDTIFTNEFVMCAKAQLQNAVPL